MSDAKYRLYRRANGTYYQQDNETGAQVSLRTRDKRAAQEKLRAANESVAQAHLNLDLARIYPRPPKRRCDSQTRIDQSWHCDRDR